MAKTHKSYILYVFVACTTLSSLIQGLPLAENSTQTPITTSNVAEKESDNRSFVKIPALPVSTVSLNKSASEDNGLVITGIPVSTVLANKTTSVPTEASAITASTASVDVNKNSTDKIDRVPPQPVTTPSTTTTPSNNTTTEKPTTTPSTTSPTTTSTTTSTAKPTTTTVTTTVSTIAPTDGPSPTVPVTTPSTPPQKDRHFDGPSFIGGIVLAVGLMAIGFISFKFYKARTERNYHTL